MGLNTGRVLSFSSIIFFSFFLFCSLSKAQTAVSSSNLFVSPVDEDLSINAVLVLPAKDNLSDIYAKPATEFLKKLVQDQRRWNLVESPDSADIQDFSENPEQVTELLSSNQAQGLFTLFITRGPKGVGLTLDFYAGREGLLFLRETKAGLQEFEVAAINKEIALLYKKIITRLPYNGVVLSRRAQNVTVNLGAKDKIRSGDELTVIQILKINRHPRYHFMIGHERAILGKIKIYKVEDALSFGTITSERDRGTIQVGTKVITDEFLNYIDTGNDIDGQPLDGLANRADKNVSFGDSPHEWKPLDPPTFGKVDLLLGLGQFSANTSLSTAGSITASSSVAPSIGALVELWLNPSWFVQAGLKQSVATANNPYSGSDPAELGFSTAQYGVHFGYNFLLGDNFWGPKIQALGGFTTYKMVADSSTPLAFTNMNFSGLNLGLRGSFPLDTESPITLGAELFFFLSPSLSESPSTSGSSSTNTINCFAMFGTYKLKERLNFKGALNFEQYTASFSGAGSRSESASSASLRATTMSGGIEFLF